MRDLGDRTEDSTIDFTFHTTNESAAPTTLAGTPAISVYKANGTTQSTAGVTLTADFDSVTGLNHVRIDTSADAFYAPGNDYSVVITTGTVNSISVVGATVATFSIENRQNGPTDIITAVPVIPQSIDLADTATWRLGVMLTNAIGDLPSTEEITPGTISIDKKSPGDLLWSNIVSSAAMSETAGFVYYDEVFDSATSYAVGDTIRITFLAVSVVVGGVTHEVIGASHYYYTHIRDTTKATHWETNTLTESYAADGAAATPAQLMYMIWSALSEFAIASTTITCKKLDGSTTSMTYTLDDADNPTSRTRAT